MLFTLDSNDVPVSVPDAKLDRTPVLPPLIHSLARWYVRIPLSTPDASDVVAMRP